MSNPSSFSITLYNHTGVTWGKYATTPTNGAAAQADGHAAPAANSWQNVSVADGGSITVAASNSSGDCQGQFMFEDTAKTTKFIVQYTVPNDSGDADVTFTADKDYPASIGMTDAWPDDLSGPSLSLGMAVYAGVAVTEWNSSNQARTAGYTVPAAGNPYTNDNARDVVNSMFQADIRSPNAVKHWYDQNTRNPYHPADYSGQIGGGGGALVAKMVSLWPSIGNATTGPDYPLVSFLADFLVPTDTSQAPLVMYVPTLTYNGYSNGDDKGPIYGLTGYTAYPLAGSGTRFDSDAVQIFLTLFLAGAHFVNIQTDQDFKNLANNANQANTGRDLYQAFKDAFADDGSQTGRHRCIGNSHYVWHSPEVNTQSWYYGGQMGEWASSGCGLLLSCLVGPTANGPYNTFMQLEGWPADNDVGTVGLISATSGGPRHGQDYAAYSQSFWNISTFGAAPYSEKRATTIFLAPAPWVPSIYSDTFMMPYVGAETPQLWLKTSLVQVPKNTPAPPSQYG